MEVESCTAFLGARCVASGRLAEVARKVKETVSETERGSILIFDDNTSEPVEVDFRGSVEDVLQKLKQQSTAAPNPEEGAVRGPGRPRLGVVSREVSLLPRHWEWLNAQPGGASAAIRKLVEEGKRANRGRDRVRRSQEAAYRFMSAIAGNMPGFEEAARALFAGSSERFEQCTNAWPDDVRNYARKLSADAFQPPQR